uniref:DWNN domain-containing protein n=1 Tax=Steinernema glaseri TaxID=37863 RepID=A0A1I7XYH5_9BILA
MPTISYREASDSTSVFKTYHHNTLLLTGAELREAIASAERIGHSEMDLLHAGSDKTFADSDTLPNECFVLYRLRRPRTISIEPSTAKPTLIYVNPERFPMAVGDRSLKDQGNRDRTPSSNSGASKKEAEEARTSPRRPRSRGRSPRRSPSPKRRRSPNRDQYRPVDELSRNYGYRQEGRRDARFDNQQRQGYCNGNQQRQGYGNRQGGPRGQDFNDRSQIHRGQNYGNRNEGPSGQNGRDRRDSLRGPDYGRRQESPRGADYRSRPDGQNYGNRTDTTRRPDYRDHQGGPRGQDYGNRPVGPRGHDYRNQPQHPRGQDYRNQPQHPRGQDYADLRAEPREQNLSHRELP